MSCEYDIRTKTVEASTIQFIDHGDQKYIDWQPGNGTRYGLLFVKVAEDIGKAESIGRWVITWVNPQKTMFVGAKSYVHFSYVQEKMRVPVSDAIVIAEAIGLVLGIGSTTSYDFDPDLNAREIMES